MAGVPQSADDRHCRCLKSPTSAQILGQYQLSRLRAGWQRDAARYQPKVPVEPLHPLTTSAPIGILPTTTRPISVQVPVPLTNRESFLQVREVATQTLVVEIAVLSPSNKQSRRGRAAYETQRRIVLASPSHLVEIDLLRGGQPMTLLQDNANSHYRILVSRAEKRPHADLYAFNLQDAIPHFPLPLKREDTEPILDLRSLLNELYDCAGYVAKIDYSQTPTPAMEPEDVQWAQRWIVQY